jgi:hypothetical protein
MTSSSSRKSWGFSCFIYRKKRFLASFNSFLIDFLKNYLIFFNFVFLNNSYLFSSSPKDGIVGIESLRNFQNK